MAAVAIGSHRSGSGTAPRWWLGLPESTDQSRSNRRENEACVRRAAVAGSGERSFSSNRFSRPVTQEARPPADGTGRGRQRSEDRGGGREGGWEMRIARTVKGPLEIGATRFT